MSDSSVSITRRLEKEIFEQEIHERMEYAYSTLNFNQNLIQFAETKANTLLVVNSIFLATAAGFLQSPIEPTAVGMVFNIMRILFLITSILSVLICLIVVNPAKDDQSLVKRRDMIFFVDILQHNSPDNYVFEFCKTRPLTLLEDLLRRCYGVSHIAKQKFNRYRTAQGITFFSCVLWIISLVMYYFC
jgi:hypothetical protein